MAYFIVKHITFRTDDLAPGTRIISMEQTNSIKELSIKNAEGPYGSFKELRQHSILFRTLQKEHPRRAQKIFEDRFIIRVNTRFIMDTDLDLSFYGNLAIILNHIFSGKVSRRFVSGIHYINPNQHKLVKVTKEPNSKGIWEAVIQAKIPREETWITKDTPSTLFPSSWSKDDLDLNIKQAYSNMHKVSSTIYKGTTKSGITIVFIIKNHRIISVYPRYE